MVANPTKSIASMTKITYPVLLEAVAGGWIAMIPGWVESKAIGVTREAALGQLQQLILRHLSDEVLSDKELVQLEIDLTEKAQHPWMRFAGCFKDDPIFDAVLEEIEANRKADREEYFRQLDDEEMLDRPDNLKETA